MTEKSPKTVEDYTRQLPQAYFIKPDQQLCIENYLQARKECDKVFEHDFYRDYLRITIALHQNSADCQDSPLLFTQNVPVKQIWSPDASTKLTGATFLVPASEVCLQDCETGCVELTYHDSTERAEIFPMSTGDQELLQFNLFFSSDYESYETCSQSVSVNFAGPEMDNSGFPHALLHLCIDLRKLPNTLAALQRDYRLLHRHMTLKQTLYANQSASALMKN